MKLEDGKELMEAVLKWMVPARNPNVIEIEFLEVDDEGNDLYYVRYKEVGNDEDIWNTVIDSEIMEQVRNEISNM